MNGRLLLGTGVVLLVVACGENKTHYTYAESIGCLRDVGKTEVTGRGNSAVRIAGEAGKTFDILFLPSGQQAKNYVKRFDVPTGILHTKGNAIVYGHQTTPNGPDITDGDMDEVEKCLA